MQSKLRNKATRQCIRIHLHILWWMACHQPLILYDIISYCIILYYIIYYIIWCYILWYDIIFYYMIWYYICIYIIFILYVCYIYICVLYLYVCVCATKDVAGILLGHECCKQKQIKKRSDKVLRILCVILAPLPISLRFWWRPTLWLANAPHPIRCWCPDLWQVEKKSSKNRQMELQMELQMVVPKSVQGWHQNISKL